MYSSRFFWIKPIARLIFKRKISGSHTISDQSLLLSTIVLNDYTNIVVITAMLLRMYKKHCSIFTLYLHSYIATHILENHVERTWIIHEQL